MICCLNYKHIFSSPCLRDLLYIEFDPPCTSKQAQELYEKHN